ncbi:MAG: TraR/DksA family transcriptional regulator [Bacillota bacterium]
MIIDTGAASRLAGILARLNERRQALRAAIVAALEQSQREDYLALAGQVHDLEDESLADLLADVRHADIGLHVHELQDIEATLTRLETGSYGTCIDCGGKIAEARLTAYPTAKRCWACQEKHERRRGAKPAASL